LTPLPEIKNKVGDMANTIAVDATKISVNRQIIALDNSEIFGPNPCEVPPNNAPIPIKIKDVPQS
jgi:hypothetical protein